MSRTRPPTRKSPLGRPTLGVDVGGVLIDRVAEGSDTSFFGDRPLETPAVPDAVGTIARLAAAQAVLAGPERKNRIMSEAEELIRARLTSLL